MELNLKRPLVFFDLETTGVDTVNDRIVEVSMIKIMPSGEEVVRTRRINPQMHIPEQATAIHGITDEMVKGAPKIKEALEAFYGFIGDAPGAPAKLLIGAKLVYERMASADRRPQLKSWKYDGRASAATFPIVLY